MAVSQPARAAAPTGTLSQMVGISYFGPVKVPPGAVELRVHGVSGTPPEALLKGTAVLIAGTPTAGFHRHRPSPDAVPSTDEGVREAYAWGGLTSGSRITSALRLLLLPFSLVNVAGWMLPGATDPSDGAPTRPADAAGTARRAAAHALVSRLLALALTAYVTLGAVWVATVALGLITTTYSLPLLATADAQARVTLLAVVVLIGLWVAIAHRTARSDQMSGSTAAKVAQAPVAAPAHHGVDVSTLWDGSPITQRLSGIHASVAIACAALLTDSARDLASTSAAIGRWAAVASLVIAALGLIALTSREAWGRSLTRIVRLTAGPLAFAAAIVAVAAPSSAVSLTRMLVRVGESLTLGMASLAVAVFVLVIIQVVVGPRGGPVTGRLYSSAFTVIGFGTAITAISGLAVLVTWWLKGRKAESLVAGLAQTIAIIGLVSVSATIVIVLLRLNPTSQLASVAWFERLRATVAHARGAIVAGAAAFAIGANVVAASYLLTGGVADPAKLGPGQHGWASWGWFVVGGVIAAVAASRLQSWPARISATVLGSAVITVGAWLAAAAIGAWLSHRGFDHYRRVLLASSDEWFVIAAVVAALLAPLGAVIAYMWRGSKDQNTRRLVGVLWDLVNFWPRQFHPWAPPPYTDTTIPALADRVSTLTHEPGARHVIVSAHSQGAIIAVPALTRLLGSGDPSVGPAKVCLLTYGQLLDCHYRWLFPWVFNPELFTQLEASLEGRWVNLYRITDPLGHPVAAMARERDREISQGLTLSLGPTFKAKTLNHGDYWYSTDVFKAALTELASD